MNITIFSDDLKLKTNIESYTSDIVIHQTNNNSTFFQDILFTKPNLLIIDTDENNITKLLQKIKDENQLVIISVAPAKGLNKLDQLSLSMSRAEVLRLYISGFNNRITIQYDPKLSNNTINIEVGA